ncbi:MAG: molybdopterin biosynthesis protein [Clostridia bacterium]
MKYEYLTNIPLDKARREYIAFLDAAGMKHSTQTIRVTDALSRVNACAIYAKLCSPHYNACAMDGIALRAQVTFGATETTPVTLNERQFIRVDTGDPLPDGCDAVIMIEDVVDNGDGITLFCAAAPWQHIRQIGEDISQGDMLLPSFTKITPAAMGAMLAGGVLEILAVKRPIVGIIPTGDEVVAPSEHPNRGDVMEFNSVIFSGMIQDWGGIAKTYPIARDKKADMQAALRQAAAECDAVLLCAGTSAGRDDYTAQIMAELGDVCCHGIAIKPGKPAVLGGIGNIPVLGIPGYPVSGIIVLEQLFKPVMERLTCDASLLEEKSVPVTMSRRLNSSLKYQEFVRARLVTTENGFSAVPLNRGAGVVTSFVKADCILNIPQNAEGADEGGSVKATLLVDEGKLRRSISIVGSHDPLIDEAADLLRQCRRDLTVASSHVGSMGGIMAIKRGEAQLAGVHLLDEVTGEYNKSYIRRYFPHGGAVLIECVQRVQGLMVKAGNPKGINDFSDMTREGISYVNRQRGSGTRILCDYLIRSIGIDAAAIYGYAREEFTHTAVAAQIAGDADAGLGIYSAAKIYDLDFIPICLEQYDILAAQSAMDSEGVREFIEILKSDAFKARLTALGGYTLSEPGRIRKC